MFSLPSTKQNRKGIAMSLPAYMKKLDLALKRTYFLAVEKARRGEHVPTPKTTMWIEKGAEQGKANVSILFPDGWRLPLLQSGTPLEVLDMQPGFLEGGKYPMSNATALKVLSHVIEVQGGEIINN